MIYTADPSGYDAFAIPLDDSDPNAKPIDPGMDRTGGELSVTFDNGDYANTPWLPAGTTVNVTGNVRLIQQLPPGVSLDTPWLAAIRVTAEGVIYGNSPDPNTSNAMGWSIGVGQAPPADGIGIGVSDRAAMGPPIVPTGSAPGAVPYWLGISAHASGYWEAGIWGFPDPVLESSPGTVLRSGEGAQPATGATSLIEYAAGAQVADTGFLVQPGAGAITIDAFMFTGGGVPVTPPPTGGAASWGVLAQ
jgi:hypothetical protein